MRFNEIRNIVSTNYVNIYKYEWKGITYYKSRCRIKGYKTIIVKSKISDKDCALKLDIELVKLGLNPINILVKNTIDISLQEDIEQHFEDVRSEYTQEQRMIDREYENERNSQPQY